MAGRPERVLEPDGSALNELASGLRQLRAEAGSPTYREMARRSGVGASTLSQAAAGDRLPTLPTLRAYVGSCGGDLAPWEERWRAAAGRAGEQPEPNGPAEPPYRGLARYEPADRAMYFGRDDLVVQLTARVRAHRLVAVVGASGSGKSSLLRAGLIPALRTAPGPGPRPAAIRVLTPGPSPATTHHALLEAVRGDGGPVGDTVLVVDQFEELFTLGADAGERAAFVGRLLAAADPAARLRVVIGVRADFFGRVAEHPGLADAVRDATVLVAPMGPAALREAVVGPATSAGLIVERTLTARIVREAGEQPGGLPLMSHALLETWRRRRGRVLTEEMYEAAGGLHGAIAATAESVHARLTPAQARVARRILLRLVTPGEGAPDTLRPVDRAELAELDASGGGTGEVLEQLVAARLLTADGDTLRLAHEALLNAWPRYRGWIEEDRERLFLHRRLTEAARTWHELDRDTGALYRGVRLSSAEAAFRPHWERASLTRLETAFLDASIRAHDHETLTSSRTTRRMRTLTSALALLLALASVCAGIGWQQNRAEQSARTRADAAQRESLSRRLASEADHLNGSDAELSMLLAVRAYRTSPTPDAYASLLRAAAVPLDRRLAPAEGAAAGPVGALAFSHDGSSLVWGVGDGGVLRTEVAGGRTTPLSAAGTQPVAALAFAPGDRKVVGGYQNAVVRSTQQPGGRFAGPAVPGPDAPRTVSAQAPAAAAAALDGTGALVAATAPGGGVMVRDTATGRARTMLPAPYVLLAVSPDGRTLAARDGEQFSVWDTATGTRRAVLPDACACTDAAFSPDGRRVVVDAAPGVTVWDLDQLRVWRLAVTSDITEKITAFTFGTDGRSLVVGYDDAAVRVFDIAEDRRTAALEGLGSAVSALSLGADGRKLAVGLANGVVALYDTTGVLLPRRLTRPGAAPSDSGSVVPLGLTSTGQRAYVTTGFAFTEGGAGLLTGTSDGGLDRWSTASGQWVRTRTGPPVAGPGVDGPDLPAQRLLADRDGDTVALLAHDGSVRVWTGAAGQARFVGGRSTAAALSPDGRTLITAGAGGTLERWSTATGAPATPHVLHTTLAAAPATMAVSPDGTQVAVNDTTGAATLLDAATGATLRHFTSGETYLPPRAQQGGTLLAFSPDGRTLATAAGNGTVFLWDPATGTLRADLPGGPTAVTSLAFSPDGRTVATGAADGSVRLHDVATHQTRNSMTAGFTPAVSIAFSPDGHTLAVATLDGTTRLFHLRLPDVTTAATAVCTALHRDLTPQERHSYLPSGPVGPGCAPV
jgi:WD40 repeat protein/transcriptional regulator with XRE-family HTH domain